MEDQPSSRGLYAGLLAFALLAASAFVGWRLLSERDASPIDSGGFDVGAAPKSRPVVPVSGAASAPAAPPSSLDYLKSDGVVRAAQTQPPPAENAPAPAAAPARTLAQSRAEFTELARRNENVVRRFAERMTAQSPVVRQYGQDWMSHPDLRSLTDQYWRDHDPIAFMAGLARAPSFPLLVKQYAGSPEIQSFVFVGLTKEAPHDLVTAGLTLMHDDASLKGTVTEVTKALGATDSLAAALGAPDTKKPAQKPGN
jgi:hypothetical protein